MAKDRVLLLAPTTAYQTADFRRAAEAMGVEVTLGTDRCHVLAEAWPEGALALDFRDPPGAAAQIADADGAAQIAGIIATDEQTALIGALAAELLGLPFNPIEATRATGDKLRLRRRLAEAGVAQPAFHVVPLESDPMAVARELQFPVVIKPRHLSTSRGVMRADNKHEYCVRFARLARLLAAPELIARDPEAARSVLIEEFVPGPEVAFEGLLRQGRLQALALFDKPDPLDGPFFAETIYVTPSSLPVAMQQAIEACVAEAASAIGLREGPIHAELRIGSGHPVVIEVAARSIGGLCGRALRFGAGISLEEVIISHALRRDLACERAAEATGVLMLPVPSAGVLRAIDGLDDAMRVPGVREVTITARVGENVMPLPEGNMYLGFVFAVGDQAAAVIAALRRAGLALRFTIAPLL
ncbi:MAG: ATP-grasp domain-containing protein [Myxococcota bacterium]|nr:ATP-grasp domain-containing protein [Myxococcota bacterium]